MENKKQGQHKSFMFVCVAKPTHQTIKCHFLFNENSVLSHFAFILF